MEDKKHIVAVTAVVKNKEEDKFLILKRSKNETAFPGKWAFPGGKLEKGELVEDTLRREVKEESGLDIEDYSKFLKNFTFVRPDGHNVVGLSFEVKAKNEEVIIPEDFDDHAWISPEELKDYDHINGMEKEVEFAFNNVK